MSRYLYILTVHAVGIGLLGVPGTTTATVLEADSFNASREGWRVYDYNGGVPDGGNVWPAANWESSGGVGDSGYIWGDDSMWWIDTPETPNSILPFIIYRNWVGGEALDLRGATVSVYLRGDGLKLKGANVYFWALNNARGARYHYTSVPLQITRGEWGQQLSFALSNNESLWNNSWQRYPNNPVSLNDVLGVCDSYGFSFVGFSDEVTGKFSMDELTITIPEPTMAVMFVTGSLARLAVFWRRRWSLTIREKCLNYFLS